VGPLPPLSGDLASRLHVGGELSAASLAVVVARESLL
jgi:hypothetical protein